MSDETSLPSAAEPYATARRFEPRPDDALLDARTSAAVRTPRLEAKPFAWCDPQTFPPRQWLFNKHFIRGYVSATIAPGGLGKSSLALVEAVAMVSSRPLLGVQVKRRLNVWVWNGEDPIDETQRRILAILLHYRVPSEEVEGRLFISSGRDIPLLIAEKVKDRIDVNERIVGELVREIKEKQIDVIVVDPFVSSHSVPENDNGAIDRVVKTWAKIADRAECAVELIHHVRKPGNGQSEFTVDDARGAVALIGAVRSARVLNSMTKEEAARADVQEQDRRSYFRLDNGKANMAPPMDGAAWHKIVSMPLDNDTEDDPGDWVGVVTKWTMPGALDGLNLADLKKVQVKIAQGEWAENHQASNWAGHAVAAALGLNAGSSADKQRIKSLLKIWIGNGALQSVRTHSARDGRMKPMIVVGNEV